MNKKGGYGLFNVHCDKPSLDSPSKYLHDYWNPPFEARHVSVTHFSEGGSGARQIKIETVIVIETNRFESTRSIILKSR